MPDGYVLVGLAVRIEKRNDGRIDPINTAVLRQISEFPFPDLSRCDGSPQIADELFG